VQSVTWWYAKCGLHLSFRVGVRKVRNAASGADCAKWHLDSALGLAAPLQKELVMQKTFWLIAFMLLPNWSVGAEPAEIEQLTRDLKADKPIARLHAIRELSKVGPAGAAAVPALTEVLHDESLAMRYEALLALEQIGPSARAAVPELVAILDGKDNRLQASAVSTLGAIGRDSLAAVPKLTKLLESDDRLLSSSAAFALARILPADDKRLPDVAQVLVKGLQDKHRNVRGDSLRGLVLIGSGAVPTLAVAIAKEAVDPHAAVAAEQAIRLIGPAAKEAIPQLTIALKSHQELVVVGAVDALATMGPAAESAVPELQSLLSGDKPLVRAHAAEALGEIGAAAAPAVGALIAALRDKDPTLRGEAVKALGLIGPAANEAVRPLIGALKEGDPKIVPLAAHALARIGADAVPELIALIKDPRMGRWGVAILRELGESAAPAVDQLVAALHGADEEMARDIMLTLGHIGPQAKSATPELIKVLRDEQSKLRVPAAFALGNMLARDAIPDLRKLIQDKDEETQLPLVAAGALVLIDSENKESVNLALPKLIAALDDKSEMVRREAAAALRQIGPAASSAAPALARSLRDEKSSVAAEFLWTLTALGPEGVTQALPNILEMLSSRDPHVRCTACYAAGSIGPAAREAIPILEKNLQEPDKFLQLASAWALVQIDAERSGIAKECVDPLIRGLGLSNPRARVEAASALGLLGPAAKSAVPALTEATHADEEEVRTAAIGALQKIAPVGTKAPSGGAGPGRSRAAK
jgi:HEAT repeat protein